MLQTHIESKNGLQSFIEASPEEELSPLGIASIQGQMKKMADFGRNGDIYVVHAAEGETVIPLEVLNANPKVRDLLFTQMTEMGLDPERYVVGNELNSLNPVTGAPEFFFSRIFKSVKKRVKKLRGTGIFTTLLPLIGQEIGVPGGPQFLRPGTAGSNLVWGMLGEYLEQGKDFDPKKTAKRLALNLAKGVALKGGLNILAGRDTLTGIDSSYFTGEGYQSTAEKFGFGDKAENIGAKAVADNLRDNIGVNTDVAAAQRVIETRPQYLGNAYTQQPPSSRGKDILVGSEGGDRLGLEQPYTTQTHRPGDRPGSRLPTTDPDAAYQQKLAKLRLNATASGTDSRVDARTSVDTPEVTASQDQRKQLLASLSPSEREEVLRAERRNNIAKLIYGDDLAMRRHYNTEKARQYEEANKTGLFGYKGPLGLPSLGNQLTDNKGLANIIDLAGYGGATYWLGDKAGLFDPDDDEEDQPDRSDLAGFVDRKTGADLLAENPEKYRLPDDALDPYLFVDREPTSVAKGGMVQKMATGGFPRRQLLVEGPGTGTSDEIPAMLSDGEFVMTNRAVEGADPSGNGDRYAGAKNLYGMMRNFEMRA